MVNHNELIHFNCNEKSACSNLTTGFYNCTLGHCYYWHDRYTCNTINDTVTIDAVQNNERLTGFFYCSGTKCTRIKPQSWTCDRRCPSLQIYPNNIVLRFKETVLMTSCESIVAYNVANGSNVGERIEPTTIWNNDSSTMHDLLHASCMTVETFMENGTIRATDCINGTRLRKKSGQIEFPAFRRMVAKSARNVLFKDQRFLPMQSALTIQKTSRLMINLQGCVNSLRDECKEFVQIYGNDGRNNTAQSRYPCYYKPTNSDVVLLYFDLIKMKRQLMISVVIPISLFIVSFISLWCIIRTVKVGDDTKMRFKFAFGEPVADTMANDNELNAMGNKKKKQLQKRLLKDGQTVVAKDIKDKGKKQKTAEKQSAVVGTVEQGLTADVSVHNADGDKTCTIHI